MATRQRVTDHIFRFIESPEPEALCISGDWGIGKTYLWRNTLERAAAEGKMGLKKYAYVSLFGVDSLEGLKLSIYENTKSYEPTCLAKVLNKLSMRKGRRFVALTPKVGEFLKKLSEFYFVLVKNQIICIDDLERKSNGLAVKDVLGLVSFLKEERGCKIVLLLNDNQLKDDDAKQFADYFEKTVDVHLRFKPGLGDSVAIALPQDDASSQALKEHCLALGIENIRVIKKIERYVRDVEPLLSQYDVSVLKKAIHSLTLFGWSYYQPTHAPPIEFLKKRDYGSRLIKQDDGEGTTEKEAAWNAQLDSYGFRSMDEFDAELLKAIKVGYFNPDAIRQCADALHKKLQLEALDGSFEEAWRAYHDSFSSDREAVLDGIYERFKKAVKTISPMNLDGTVRLFKELGRNDQAEELLKFYLDNRDEPQSFWDLERYPFAGNIQDPDVRTAMKEKYASFGPKVVDPAELFERLSLNKGWVEEEIIAVSKLPVDDIYKLFKETHGRKLHRVISGALIADRISNPSDAMKNMTAVAKQALEKIGKESKINALRVQRYGIDVQPEQ